jgi:hypothetical protein
MRFIGISLALILVLLPVQSRAQVQQEQFRVTALFKDLMEAAYCIGTIDRRLEQTNVCSNLERFQEGEVRDHWQKYCSDSDTLKKRYQTFIRNNDFRMRYTSSSAAAAEKEGREDADFCSYNKIRKICPTYAGECVNSIERCARMTKCDTPRSPF